MANSLREVKMRINATKNTAQITKAMYMVSQSKVKKAEKTYSNYRDFMSRISDLVVSIVSNKSSDYIHPMLVEREIKKTAYILVTSDRGLAGAYNSNIFKEFDNIIKNNHSSKDEYICGAIGKQGFLHLRKRQVPILIDEPLFIRDDVLFIDLLDFANSFIDLYLSLKIDKIVIIYNHFINSITQEIVSKSLLPIEKIEGNKINLDYIYESGIEKTIDTLLPMYIQDIIYGIILDSKISEHCARRNAMQTATDNAKEVCDKLQLLYNRARQETITNELIDVIGGANAIGGK